MNRVNLSVFAIVAVAAMMVAASIAPAYAAAKVADIKLNSTFSGSGLGGAFCGDDDGFMGHTNGFFTAWDNGKFNFHLVTNVVLTTASGDPSGTFLATDHTVESPFDGADVFPIVVQSNGIVTCGAGGQVFNGHFGFTIHQDGSVTPHF